MQIASMGRLDQYYEPTPAKAFAVEMPAEFGNLGVSYTRFSMTAAGGRDLPPFRVAVSALSWRMPYVRTGALRSAVGLRVAQFDMAFSDTIIVEGLRGEKELLVGLTTRVTAPLRGPLRLRIDAELSRVFLNVPVTITAVAGGIEYSFAAPRWLRDFLR